MSEDYWAGAVWVYHANITNNGSNSGNHVYAVSPGVGNEMELLYGSIRNLDAAARTANVEIDDGTNIFVSLVTAVSISASARTSFPGASSVASSSPVAAGSRIILAGGMRLNATLAAVAVSQDSRFGIACRIRGGVPTVTLTSPADAVEVVDINRVF